jgi:hypothetical protein
MHNRLLRGLIPALVLAALPALSSAGVFVGLSVNIAPPALPVYVQPPCPQPGYIWTPGYWGWNAGAYYWVPGTWVMPPRVGLLWTPGYWGWDGGVYLWHAGYWGPHVGFYGGVNYGFGYDGVGFAGGYWRGGVFFYNRAVVRVGPGFASHVYYHPVVYRAAYAHVSFNGGPGGVMARASREQIMAAHERHIAFTPMQQRQQRMAFADRAMRADYNHGRPAFGATARPGAFHGNGGFAPRGAAMHRQAEFGRQQRPEFGRQQQRGSRPMARRSQRPMERSERRGPAARHPAPRQQRGRPQRERHPPQKRGDRGR